MRITRALVLLVLTGALVLGYAGAAPASADTGYRDFSYGNGINNSPTGEKPQSKLWINDGTWWGLLFDPVTEDWYIYRLDPSTQTWEKTSTLVEKRSSARSDVLWDGSRLYVASAPSNTQSTNLAAELRRFSYDKASKSYTLDAGFPAKVASNPLEAIVLDKDTTGRLWVTYTQGSKVYVNHSLTSDSSWGTPFVLPVNGTTVDPDDISAVVAFDSKIGVMWSNQIDGTFYFATHNDGDPGNAWQGGVAMQGNKYSDDHINLKSLQADSSGRVFAAVKTSAGDVANPDSNAPLIDLLVLGTDGKWKQPVTFGRVQDDHTRPIVIIDEQNRNLYMFATARVNGGTIYYKQAPLDRVSFANGKGTPFIQSSADTIVNNATSTKQNVNSASGLVVLASDTNSKYYLHNTLNLSSNNADTTAPTVSSVTPADAATGVAAAENAEVTFSEAMDPATITGSTFTLLKQGATTPVEAQVSYDSATKKATLDPSVDLEAGATYTATLKGGASGVKDAAGNPLAEDKTWSFSTAAAPPPPDTTAPDTAIDSGPSGTITVADATFTFSSSEANSTFECSLDGAAYSTCTSPKSYTNLPNGSHTFDVRATDGAGNVDATAASRTFTVDVPPPPPQILTFSPEADARVEALSPNKNYGASSTLKVDGSPRQESYLRFAVNGVSGTVSSVKLRVYVGTNGGVDGPPVYTTGNAWTETSLTWNNRPANISGATDDKGSIATNSWVEYDVTPLVTGNGTYSFNLPGISGDGIDFNSREAANNQPQLVVTSNP